MTENSCSNSILKWLTTSTILLYDLSTAIPKRHHLLPYSVIEIQTGFTFLVQAYPGCPAKEAVKRVLLLLVSTVKYI